MSAAVDSQQCWERVHASYTPYQNHLVTRGIPGKSVDEFLCKLVAVSCILEATPDGGFDVFFSSPAYFVHFQDGWSQEEFPVSSFPHDAFRVFHLEQEGEEWKVVDAGSDVIRGAQRVAPEDIPPPNRSIE